MPGTNHHVATTSQLYGGSPLKPREMQDIDLIRAKTADQLRQNDKKVLKKMRNLAAESKATPPHTPRKRGSQATEIYFSPITVDVNNVELSDPLPTPPKTPTQESYNTEQAIRKTITNALSNYSKEQLLRPKLVLEPDSVDRLVAALVNAPMVQQHVRRQSSGSPTIPALCSPITDAHKPLQVRLGGIALIDQVKQGSPIRLLTKNYRRGPNMLQVGKGRYLNSAYGPGVDCSLRIEQLSTGATKQRCRVMYQVVSQVLERKTERKVYLLVADFDVTESFTKAALTELAEQSGLGFGDIEVNPTTNKAQEDASKDDIDWCALADELQTTCKINGMVQTTAESFAHLQTENCGMQTLTLISELERIKSKHQDFLILRSHESHENGAPSSMSIPWISQHLDCRGAGDRSPVSSDDARQFREQLIGAVAKKFVQKAPFSTTLSLGGKQKPVQCMPMDEGGGQGNIAWICFIRDAVEM